MNDYKISYTLGGSDIDTTTITERNEAAARKAFKMFSKAGTITNIELIHENTCATKDQERETLEKIKTMVAELGPNSYVATAFEGVFEVAELNIQDDAAYSLKNRLDAAETREEKTARALLDAEKKVKELEQALVAAESKIRSQDTGIEELIQKDDERKEAIIRMEAQLTEAHSATGDAERRAEEAEAQVIQLKAKLYDYMTA